MNRTLTWKLAARYLRGRGSANVVPILSRVSMVAIAVSSAAMIVIFSVFNGLEGVVKDLYKAFYPDVRITAARGKFFLPDAAKMAAIRAIPGVRHVSSVIEDNALANNNDEQKVVTLKGIDKEYLAVNDLSESIVSGEKSLWTTTTYSAIAGRRILNELGADVTNIFSQLEMYYPDPSVTNPEANPLSAYSSLQLHPVGMFSVQDEFDSKYILAPLPLVQTLFHQQGRISSVEISVDPGTAPAIRKAVRELMGSGFLVETRYEQNKTVYMVMTGEKWAIYVILVFVLLIASFNMVGALGMLVMEKQRDISILRAMGAEPASIRNIFLLEGALWALVGGSIGLCLGIALCLLQQHFGFVKMGGDFLIDAYPVSINPLDILLVLATVVAVSLLAGWYPALRAARITEVK